jgi:putative ABC transport system permease protein
MNVLIGALTIGIVLALLALGVFISFRIFAFPDITADGSITLGACVTTILLVTEPTPIGKALVVAVVAGLAAALFAAWLLFAEGKPFASLLGISLGTGAVIGGSLFLFLLYRNPILATVAGFAGGLLAGTATGVLHTKFKINGLLSGILVMTALYSVNLHVLGRSNVSLQSVTTLADYSGTAGSKILGGRELISVSGWEIATRDAGILVLSFVAIMMVGFALYSFFRTGLGTTMRATGDNPQMIRALGVNVGNMMIAGLALSNGLIALSGSLFAQYQGFADVQMGIGMVVWGLASVIIGEALVGTGHFGLALAGAVMGSILFRLLVAIALRAGLNPVDLKLITALFVFVALIFPSVWAQVRKMLLRPGRKPEILLQSPPP